MSLSCRSLRFEICNSTVFILNHPNGGKWPDLLLRVCLVKETEPKGPSSLLFFRYSKNSYWNSVPLFYFILFFDLTRLVCTLSGPFEVQSPTEPLNFGQGGQQEIWLPQQLETGSVVEVSGDQFPSREIMVKRQWRLGLVLQPLQTLHSRSPLNTTQVFCPGMSQS